MKEYSMEAHSGESRGSSPNSRDPRSNYRGPRHPLSGGAAGRNADFPLKILVLSDMVGAIIGRSGGTIKQITQETRARVDVHRKDNAGSLEKMITIYGNPENCSKACQKIMQVMQVEANNINKGEIPLKILAPNNLIGRIIGKNGNTIKRIMETTNTKIAVSTNLHPVNNFNFERVITIKGKLEDICHAEQMVSTKLRQSYESDLAVNVPQASMFPGLHPMAVMQTLGSHNYPPSRGAPGPAPAPLFGMFGGASYMPSVMPYGASAPPPLSLTPGHGGSSMPSLQQAEKETVYLYIPNSAVGAIIGTGGSTIRDMISSSGASIKVAHPKDEHQPQTLQSETQTPATGSQPSSSQSIDKSSERKVTIIGTPDAQWRAQFMIFRKVGYEGLAGPQEATLKVEIFVPPSQVGRIIGKGGATVRELQRLTRATIKLPEQGEACNSEETPVHIIGDFVSVQAAQRQIRTLAWRGTQPGAPGAARVNRLKGTQSQIHPNHQQLPAEMSSPSYTQQQETIGEDPTVTQFRTTSASQQDDQEQQPQEQELQQQQQQQQQEPSCSLVLPQQE